MKYLATITLAMFGLMPSMEAQAQAQFRPNSGRNVTKQIRCESWDDRYAECGAGGFIVDAYLSARHSKSDCNLGSSWGYLGEKIWVNKGCRATFTVSIGNGRGDGGRGGGGRGDGGRGDGRGRDRNSEIVTCESWDQREATCRVRRNIDEVLLVNRHSNSACIQGSSWGVDYRRNFIWVSNGCRADFRVYYRRGRW